MHRKQKTVKTDCSCEDRLEAESTMKVPSIVHTESAREESAEILLERILSRTNMAEAHKRDMHPCSEDPCYFSEGFMRWQHLPELYSCGSSIRSSEKVRQ